MMGTAANLAHPLNHSCELHGGELCWRASGGNCVDLSREGPWGRFVEL